MNYQPIGLQALKSFRGKQVSVALTKKKETSLGRIDEKKKKQVSVALTVGAAATVLQWQWQWQHRYLLMLKPGGELSCHNLVLVDDSLNSCLAMRHIDLLDLVQSSLPTH